MKKKNRTHAEAMYPDSALLDILRHCTTVMQDEEYARKHGIPQEYVRQIRTRINARAKRLAMNDSIPEIKEAFPDNLWD